MSAKTKLNRNSTSFQLELNTYLKNVKWESTYDFLKYYQNITRMYFDKLDIDSRGLLITHQMGLGKSIMAIAIAMDMIKSGRAVIILLTKSLQSNMEESIRKYVRMRAEHEPEYHLGRLNSEDLNKWIKRNFSFVSMNASNMLKQLNRAAEGHSVEEFDKVLEDRLGEITKMASLDGKLLIVDEAHNLFRAITNGSKNGIGLYEMAMRARNLKLVFLTGTPITNDPFEIVPCFNMLGSNYPNVTILPENYRDFSKFFVDEDLGRIKNKEKFQNRILGLVSNVTHSSKTVIESKNRAEFPEDLGVTVVRVPMRASQFAAYQLARDREKDEGTQPGGQFKVRTQELPMMVKPKSFAASTYRVKSRQLSNYCPPDSMREESDYRKIPKEMLSSAKFDEIIKDITDAPDQLHLLYSQFVGMGGIGTFSEYLKYRGWEEVAISRDVGTRVKSEPIRTVPSDHIADTVNDDITDDIADGIITDDIIDDSDNAVGDDGVVGSRDQNKQYVDVFNDTKYLDDIASELLKQYHGNFYGGDDETSSGDVATKSTSLHDEHSTSIIQDLIQSSKLLRIRYATDDDIKQLKKIADIDFEPWMKRPKAVLVNDELNAFALVEYKLSDTGVGKIELMTVGTDDKLYRAIFQKVINGLMSHKSGSWNADEYYTIGDYEVDVSRVVYNDILGNMEVHNDVIRGGRDAPMKFAIISGNVDQADRDAIVNMYNDPANKHGGLIDLLIISSTGAEGLDTKGTRNVYIMEPYWNYARILQIQYRAIRNDSHKHLPADEKKVRTRIYLSVAPDGSGPTTDEELYESSVKIHATNQSFMAAINEVAIECHINEHENCRVCSPTGKPLFTKDVRFDINATDPCAEVREETVKATEIIVDDKKYHYIDNPDSVYEYSIFIHDPALNAFKRLPETSEEFIRVVKHLPTK